MYHFGALSLRNARSIIHLLPRLPHCRNARLFRTLKRVSSTPQCTKLFCYKRNNVCFSNVANSNGNCWKCHHAVALQEETLFCSGCGVIQPPLQNRTLFEILGCKETFSIDHTDLSYKFRLLQSQLHPDKFSQASKEEMLYSSDHSSLVNLSYKTLTSALARGEYLLTLKGNSIEEDQTEFGGSFLAEIMEANERLDELSGTEELIEFQKEIEGLSVQQDINTVTNTPQNESGSPSVNYAHCLRPQNHPSLDNIQECIKNAADGFVIDDIVAAKDAIKRLKFYQSIMGQVKNKLVP